MRDSVVVEGIVGSRVEVDPITSEMRVLAVSTSVVSAKISEIISLIFSVVVGSVVVAKVDKASVKT